MLKGKEVSVVQGQKTITGIAQGVNQKGYLIIGDEHHHLREVGSGEASIQSFNNPLKERIKKNYSAEDSSGPFSC